MSQKVRNSGVLATALKYFSRGHIAVYQRTNGLLGHRLLWFPAALLTTIGRKSGKPRTTAMLYYRDGDKVILPASFGGRAKDPLWYRNLKANPDVTVQIRDEIMHLRARDASHEERRRYWPILVQMYPPYQNYREAAERENREIPLVVCEPAGS
nr:nitroreductase family deazaflavin-dependent oxidoreductase [Mycobacterium sp. MYCO198283]